MIDLLLIIIIFVTAAFCFKVQNAALRKASARRRTAAAVTPAQPEDFDGIMHTIDLIGEEEFRDMSRRIRDIMKRHSEEKAVTVSMTCGPDTERGAAGLHSILPGSQLQLSICGEGGVRWFDVYSRGDRIGRIALAEAELIGNIMGKNSLTGAYVAEQNCFGIDDLCCLSIIIFYKPHTSRRSDPVNSIRAQSTQKPLDICMN